jgi:hypothetical protein
LQDRLQNGTHKEGGDAADQSIYGRMRLRTEYKGKISRMKNVSTESSGRKKLCLWVEENCVFAEKFLIKKLNNIGTTDGRDFRSVRLR